MSRFIIYAVILAALGVSIAICNSADEVKEIKARVERQRAALREETLRQAERARRQPPEKTQPKRSVSACGSIEFVRDRRGEWHAFQIGSGMKMPRGATGIARRDWMKFQNALDMIGGASGRVPMSVICDAVGVR